VTHDRGIAEYAQRIITVRDGKVSGIEEVHRL
jgi:ABC-type lipoprotein export system ATPase subunit